MSGYIVVDDIDLALLGYNNIAQHCSSVPSRISECEDTSTEVTVCYTKPYRKANLKCSISRRLSVIDINLLPDEVIKAYGI